MKRKIFHQELMTTDLGFNYQLRLSNRKTAAIEIKQGIVTVAAPKHANKQQLHQWVSDKSNWILNKLEQHQAQALTTPQRQYTADEVWPFIGHDYSLKIIYNKRAKPFILDNKIYVCLNFDEQKYSTEQQQKKIKQQLTDWYKDSARDYMVPKTEQLASTLGKRISHIQFRRTKTKWGHCTSRGVIQYNWLIMMAPKAIIDYLIIHEASHLVHPNHSPKFWQLVAQLNPNFKQHKQWLQQHGHSMNI